jgi:ABC-type nitrate/sulfonate/bicarbonate transport system substrate-binding protein
MQAGIFQKHGIELENFGTQGAGETLQAVISGSADIGIGIGTSGAMRAFVRGAPIRVIAAAYAGTGDQYWYVKPDSPLKTLADATDKHTMSYSTNGATSHADCARVRQAARRQGEADRDRRPARHLHDDDERAGRYRLGRDASSA